MGINASGRGRGWPRRQSHWYPAGSASKGPGKSQGEEPSPTPPFAPPASPASTSHNSSSSSPTSSSPQTPWSPCPLWLRIPRVSALCVLPWLLGALSSRKSFGNTPLAETPPQQPFPLSAICSQETRGPSDHSCLRLGAWSALPADGWVSLHPGGHVGVSCGWSSRCRGQH